MVNSIIFSRVVRHDLNLIIGALKPENLPSSMDTPIPSKPTLYLRSGFYLVSFLLTAIFFGSLIIIFFFTSIDFRLKIAKLWGQSNLWLLRVICKLNYVIEGKEHITDQNAIVLCTHQSIWETMALQTFIPLGRWVFKRELIFIPFFGWALPFIDLIAINRRGGGAAINHLLREGTEKLQQGKWIILFPEGTRAAPGIERTYKSGGALLAEKSGYPVLPITHNAGEFWPRQSFIKWPGTITVCIGPIIDSRDKKAKDIQTEVHGWIEDKLREISNPERWNRKQ